MTSEAGEPTTYGSPVINSQWYSWTATTAGTVTFGTCNPSGSTTTNFDTTIGVYTGSAVAALTLVAQNDDTPGCGSSNTASPFYASSVTFTATAGVTYRIQIDGYGSATGNFQLFYGYTGYVTSIVTGTAAEGGATGSFNIRLTSAPTGDVTIVVGASSQCTFSPNTLTFTTANWNTNQAVAVTAIDDLSVEGSHTCMPASITASGGGVQNSPVPPPSFLLIDNDFAVVTITRTTNGNEAGPVAAVFTVTQNTVSAVDTVVNLTRSGTATLTSDYTSPGNRATIPAGATSTTVTYPVVNDAAVEGDETLIVTLSSIQSGQAQLGTPTAATATIFDNDAPTVTIANTTNGSEAGPTNGVMTLTLSQTRPTVVTVAYSVSGTATSALDYTALSGSINIPANTPTTTLSIPVLDDTIVENAETVIVTLTSVTSGTATIGAVVTATNAITDNDSAIVTVANTTNGAESGPVNGIMTVTQSNVSTVDTILSYSVSGTASAGIDYTALSGTVTVLAGQTTASVSIPVLDDTLYDPAETVIVTLTSVNSGLNTTLGTTLAATNTLADDDVANPLLQLVKAANTAGPVSVGNIITYTYAVTNSGNVPISAIYVSDVHNGYGTLSDIAAETLTDVAPLSDSSDTVSNDGNWSVLAPGDTVTFTSTYSVVQADIDNLQ